MPFSRIDRKVALLRLNLSNAAIAGEIGVDESLVSHVIAGRKRSGPKARQIIRYVAEKIGAPEHEVFPGSDRRTERPAGKRALASVGADGDKRTGEDRRKAS
jgi:hypothetical protein